MRASESTYRKVAECCSHYSLEDGKGRKAGGESAKNCACSGDDAVCSCTTCRHFEKEHCDIDLYDKIVEARGFHD